MAETITSKELAKELRGHFSNGATPQEIQEHLRKHDEHVDDVADFLSRSSQYVRREGARYFTK